MIYKEITVSTTSEASDLVADIFWEEGGSGVAVIDKEDILQLYKSDVIWDYIEENLLKEKENTAYVKGFVPEDCFEDKIKNIREGLERLKNNSGYIGSLEITVKDIDESEWFETWKKHYQPIYIKDIIICPVWNSVKDDGKKVIYLDPGMAFGTGEHETTKMCIELMQDYKIKGETVIDIGCGSGILGVCAAVCGAEAVYMSDIDPVALSASQKTAELNKVEHLVNISKEIPLGVKGGIIFLNIVADVLIFYADKVKELIKCGGTVILSGIIKERLDSVIKVYGDNGFTTQKILSENDWRAVSLIKNTK